MFNTRKHRKTIIKKEKKKYIYLKNNTKCFNIYFFIYVFIFYYFYVPYLVLKDFSVKQLKC